jgi:hypothetical protein
MLIIAVFALFLGTVAALGVMGWEGPNVPSIFFSRSRDPLEPRGSEYGRFLSTILNLGIGCVVGYFIACGVGIFTPKHMVTVEELELVPINQNGQALYVNIHLEPTEPPGDLTSGIARYSFIGKVNGDEIPKEIRDNKNSVQIRKDSRLGGKLIQFEPALRGKTDPSWGLFAIPTGSTRYEFHVPPNSVGTF